MGKNTKYVVAGTIAVFTISGALLYLQYKKLMDYAFKFKNIKANRVAGDNLNIDIFLDFTNKSALKIQIDSLETKAYLNDVEVTRVMNDKRQVIQPEAVSPLSFNVQINPKKAVASIGKNAVDILLNPDKIRIKFDIKAKVTLLSFIPISIPYVYETTLKQLLTPTPPVK